MRERINGHLMGWDRVGSKGDKWDCDEQQGFYRRKIMDVFGRKFDDQRINKPSQQVSHHPSSFGSSHIYIYIYVYIYINNIQLRHVNDIQLSELTSIVTKKTMQLG